jgi:MFS family permease
MTIPVYILGAISLVTQVYFSDRLKRRGVFIIGSCVPVAVGYLICVWSNNHYTGYAGMFILVLGKCLFPSVLILANIVLGLYPISTLAVTWATNTFSPDAKRALGLPLVFTIADLSSMISSQLYPAEQGPRYIQGNAVSAGLTVVAAVLYSVCWLLLRHRNNKKAELIAEGAATNGLEGDRSLDSMYIL